jgi:hypothetical protein
MKLLAKSEAHLKVKKDNEDLVEMNIRLRKYLKDITEKLNTIKDTYEPEKVKKLRDFEEFTKDIQSKKSKLLEELKDIETSIEKKKEMYYSLINRQDELQEKAYLIKQEETKLNLRQSFVTQLEQSWREKQLSAN